MKIKKIGRFEVTGREWNMYGGTRIYFTLLEYGNYSKNPPLACWSKDKEKFVRCKNRVGPRLENAIKEEFNLGE